MPEVKNSVKEASEKIRVLSHKSSASISEKDVREAIGGISAEDREELIRVIRIMAKEESERFSNEQKNIMSEAEHSRQFGGGLPDHMADYYDNEVRSLHRHEREAPSAYGQIEKLIKEISDVH